MNGQSVAIFQLVEDTNSRAFAQRKIENLIKYIYEANFREESIKIINKPSTRPRLGNISSTKRIPSGNSLFTIFILRAEQATHGIIETPNHSCP